MNRTLTRGSNPREPHRRKGSSDPTPQAQIKISRRENIRPRQANYGVETWGPSGVQIPARGTSCQARVRGPKQKGRPSYHSANDNVATLSTPVKNPRYNALRAVSGSKHRIRNHRSITLVGTYLVLNLQRRISDV